MPSFSRQPCPIWLFVDLEGNILDDTYFAHFLENTIPYLPQPPYKDPQGIAPWDNPLRFHPNGTLPDNLYFEDGLTYRIEIRQGDTQADPLIYLIENFVAGGGDIPTPTESSGMENQITNPQFAFVQFNDVMTVTNTGTNEYVVAPGWVLEVSSVGQTVVTLEQVTIAGDENVPTDSPTNPGYALKISVISGTLSYLRLRQRFQGMGALWASEAVSVTYTGKMDAFSAEVSVWYRPSTTVPANTPIRLSNETLTTTYQVIYGGALIGASTNSDQGDDAYVDIYFDLPLIGTVYLTNIQILASDTPENFKYEQTSIERQQDHTYHYYANSLLRQPKDNLLTGWTFGINPWQFRSYVSSNLINNAYTADQTIVIQQEYILNNIGSNIAVGAGTFAENYAFEVKAVTANNKFAMIQYIDPSTMWPYWGKKLSAMVNAYISSPTHSTTCRFKVKLIYKAGLPSPTTRTYPIASWTAVAGSDPVLEGTWTAISALNDPTYTLGDDSAPFNFDSFELPVSTDASMTLGIMLYTLDPLDETATADRILFDRISLVHNDFAIDANPETFDESLRKCQFYYEKSYAQDVLPATATIQGAVYNNNPISSDGGSDTNVYANSFTVQYRTVKRIAPTNANTSLKFYAPSGAADDVRIGVWGGTGAYAAPTSGSNPSNWPLTNFTLLSATQDRAVFQPANTTRIMQFSGSPAGSRQGDLYFHYVADVRLGV